MNALFTVLTQNILPIALIAGFGYWLQRRNRVDKDALNSVVLNILSPALVFSALADSELTGADLADMVVFTATYVVAMGVLAFVVARGLRLAWPEMAVFMTTVMFVNGGNFGITLNTLRYGEAGLSRAVIFNVVSTLLVYSVGIFIATYGHLNWRGALKRLGRLPVFYAAVLAVVVYVLSIPIPAPIMSAVSITGQAAIPMLLILLGMQMADLRAGADGHIVWPAVGVRLIAGPLVGLALATALGLQGQTRSTAIIEAAMPAAVVNIVLAAEFGLPTSPAARIVVASTLLSPLTIALTIALLGL